MIMPVKLDAIPGLVPVIYNDIKTMVNYYRNGLPDLANGDSDATSAWVSVSEILNLIADNNANGIRIYYGRHDINGTVYPGKHNVILVATRDVVEPSKPIPEQSDDLLNFDATAGPVNSVSVSYDYDGMGDDQIPLCPPRCPLRPVFP
jgi:hypothetical protein